MLLPLLPICDSILFKQLLCPCLTGIGDINIISDISQIGKAGYYVVLFFIGHREAPDTLLEKLYAEVERHITEYGVTDFVVGRYGRFDGMAAKGGKAAE